SAAWSKQDSPDLCEQRLLNYAVPDAGNVAFVEVGIAIAIVWRRIARLIRDGCVNSILAEGIANLIDRNRCVDAGVDGDDHIDGRTGCTCSQGYAHRKSNARYSIKRWRRTYPGRR